MAIKLAVATFGVSAAFRIYRSRSQNKSNQLTTLTRGRLGSDGSLAPLCEVNDETTDYAHPSAGRRNSISS